MKIQRPDFGDIPQGVCQPRQSAQALSEYPLGWMPEHAGKRSIRGNAELGTEAEQRGDTNILWQLVTTGDSVR
jgi:hypothetical protein